MHRVKVRVVEDALDANNTIARANRADFDAHDVTVINLMSSPGADIRFTTVTPARSKSARLARAMVVLASSTSSTTRTFVRCIYILEIFR